MNETIESLNMGVIRGGITAVTMICFLGICWWAYRAGNRARFEEDARLPFADEAQVGDGPRGEHER